MHITLHGGVGVGLKYGKNSIGSNRPNTFFVYSCYFHYFNLACVCPLFLFLGTLFSLLLISVHSQTSILVHVRPVIYSSAHVRPVHDNNNIFTIILIMLCSLFTILWHQPLPFRITTIHVFLNMDIYILILITYMFIKYKYSHFYITRVSAVFYLHPVYITLVLEF